MKGKWMLMITVVICSLFMGCQSNNTDERLIPSPPPKELPRRIIILGIDETGSYKLWDHAKNMAFQVIDALQPGDVFYCRRITDNSYLASCSIIRLEIPLITQPDDSNPFDKRSKNIYRSQLFQIDLMKREAKSRLDVVRFTNANNTDIFGFLAEASDKFANIPNDYQRLIIIASDLKDNVGYKVKLDLTGAQIIVAGFQKSKDPGKTQKLKARWVDAFKNAGAVRILFLSVEEKFSMDLFQGVK